MTTLETKHFTVDFSDSLYVDEEYIANQLEYMSDNQLMYLLDVIEGLLDKPVTKPVTQEG